MRQARGQRIQIAIGIDGDSNKPDLDPDSARQGRRYGRAIQKQRGVEAW
jgi:hypothetical protein